MLEEKLLLVSEAILRFEDLWFSNVYFGGNVWRLIRACDDEHVLFHAMTGENIRKLVKDGVIIRKPTKIHSGSRARRMKEAKRKGRHSGYGMNDLSLEPRIWFGTLIC